jgi:hypothetical protein
MSRRAPYHSQERKECINPFRVKGHLEFDSDCESSPYCYVTFTTFRLYLDHEVDTSNPREAVASKSIAYHGINSKHYGFWPGDMHIRNLRRTQG